MRKTIDSAERFGARAWVSVTPVRLTFDRRIVVTVLVLLSLSLSYCPSVCGDTGGLRIKINRIESANLPLVRCFASVTNLAGKPISGLAKQNFRVVEQGRPITRYTVSSAAKDGTGTAIVLVIDKSGSMKGRAISSAVAAARDFIGRLSSGDKVAVIAFSDSVGPETPLTTDRRAAQSLLGNIVAKGGTRLFDSTSRAIEYVAESDARKKAVLILTDGNDTGSKTSGAKCVADAKHAGVNLYCVGLGATVDHGVLRGLAEQTGGQEYAVHDPDDLVDIYRNIAALLLQEYTITYESPLARGKPYWRNVTVGVIYRGVKADSAKQYVASSDRISPAVSRGNSLLAGLQARVLILAFVGLNLVLLIAFLIKRIGGNAA